MICQTISAAAKSNLLFVISQSLTRFMRAGCVYVLQDKVNNFSGKEREKIFDIRSLKHCADNTKTQARTFTLTV
jgi:hypothetical protein